MKVCVQDMVTHSRWELCWFHMGQFYRNSPQRNRSSMHELSISAQVPQQIHLRPKNQETAWLNSFLNYYFLLYISASVHHSHCRAITAATHAQTMYTIYTVQGGLLLRNVAQNATGGSTAKALLLPG